MLFLGVELKLLRWLLCMESVGLELRADWLVNGTLIGVGCLDILFGIEGTPCRASS